MTPNIRFVYAVVLGLSLLPVQGWPAFAADPAQPSPSTGQSTDQNADQNKEGPRHRWCKDDPKKCEERHEQWCKDNPEKCKERKERHEQWCKDNPEKCKERKERHEQWCKDHPDKCQKRDGDSSAKPSDKPSDSTTPAPTQ